jgi:very-short-patch-repair endonuclease
VRNQKSLRHAKQSRSEMTPAEARLWYNLRAGRFGSYKFRRHTVIGPYVGDFTCRGAMLVIEVDGDTHATTQEYDEERTRDMAAVGWRVVRFTNAEVMGNIEGVLTHLAALLGPSPDLTSFGHPLP